MQKLLNKFVSLKFASVMKYYGKKSNLLTQLPVYQKSLEIFKMGREVSRSVANNSNILHWKLSNKPSENYADQIVFQSLKLPQEIVAISTNSNLYSRKMKVRSTYSILHLLFQKAEKLELYTNGKEKEYLKLFRLELHKFRILYQQWVKNLRI